jgi:hypothetical protein
MLLAAPVIAQQQVVPNAAILEIEEEVVREYSVEMIIFEYVGSAAGASELFEPDPPAEPIFEAPVDENGFILDFPQEPLAESPPAVEELPLTIDDPQADEIEEPFVLMPGEELELIPTLEQSGVRFLEPGEYQLSAAYEKLVNLDAYRPLMHTAWEQPVYEMEDTEPLHLRRIGDPPLRLDGSVSLYLSRFLHLVVDVSLEHKSPQAVPAADPRDRYFGDRRSRSSFGFETEYETPSVFYRIQEDRIVRNNELRYYDHPKFGIIARITRVEEDEPESIDTTGDLLPGVN